jgi:phosphatidylglycerol:prolipoprotein diacylglycerol transferase
MRSVLLSLGPWEWPAVIWIALFLAIGVLAWRRLERLLGEESAPINGRWFAFTLPLVLAAAIGLFLVINRFAPMEIKSYGVMLLLGFTGGTLYISRVGTPRGLPAQAAVDLVLMQLVSAIVGARVIFVLTMLGDYARAPLTILDVWRGGLSFHGGLLGALVATWLFCRWRRVRFAVLADLCSPALCIGYAVTRVGCFLNGCCHGHATDLPWGIVFPENVREFPMPVHPTQLYAMVGSIVLFFMLRAAWPRMRRPGQLFPLYLFLYSILRYGCEQTRRGATGEIVAWFPAMTVGQVACVFIALGGLIAFLILQRMPYENPLTAMAAVPEEAPPAPASTPQKPGKKSKA